MGKNHKWTPIRTVSSVETPLRSKIPYFSVANVRLGAGTLLLIYGSVRFLQWDGVPDHSGWWAQHYLDVTFLGQSSPIVWPSQSRDLSSLDIFLQGQLNSLIIGTLLEFDQRTRIQSFNRYWWSARYVSCILERLRISTFYSVCIPV